MKQPAYLLIPLIAVVLASCSSIGSSPVQLIQGVWETDVGGFSVTHVYSEATVTVEGYAPIPFSLDGDQLVVMTEGAAARIVSFPADNRMTQTDPLTGSVQEFIRVP